LCIITGIFQSNYKVWTPIIFLQFSKNCFQITPKVTAV
jgi:hypothetical protein